MTRQADNARPDRVTAVERRIQALNLRKAGLTYSQIGRQMGISKARAHKIVTEELYKLRTELGEQVDQVRTLEEERLDMLLRAIIQRATEGAELGAIDRVLKIMERRARLLGLDAPEKIAPTDPSGTNPYLAMNDEEIREALYELASKSNDLRLNPSTP